METNQFSQSFQILFAFALLVPVFIKLGITIIRYNTKKSTAPIRLPPGPWKLPIIGNMHQLAAGGPLTHQVMTQLGKKYGSLMHLQLGEVSTIVISSADTAKQVMKTQDINFSSRPPLLAMKIFVYDYTSVGFAPYGEYWRKMKKTCIVNFLSAKHVQSFRSLREEEFSGLIKWLDIQAGIGSPVNLTKKLHSTLSSLVARAAFGKRFKDQETFISLIDKGGKLAAGFNVADFFPSFKLLHGISGIQGKLQSLHKKADKILEDFILEHIAAASNGVGASNDQNLLDVLLRFQKEENQITHDNIKAVVLDMFGAGSETSATIIDWAMAELLKNPSVLNKAQEEVRDLFNDKGCVDETYFDNLKYLKSVIKETLRLHPPLPFLLPRISRGKCEINGYEIPAKTQVFVNAWAIGRDPRYWKEPECFKPERFLDSSIDFSGNNFEYIPFGAGRRICPGMSFGLATLELPLALLLYHFDWKLPVGRSHQDLDMTETFGLSVTRKLDLYAIPIVSRPFTV
ncbi:premnaspirodiene oxygenase-like [Lycium barbarum]|uniref:premnaspirodiene oxygenase-like n=1 Tax=Lycium barbarum TaxID=112863 RepID=UPI00293E99A1|nr:premnaspirodiene oxygenase-like [Lycium barbarum]